MNREILHFLNLRIVIDDEDDSDDDDDNELFLRNG